MLKSLYAATVLFASLALGEYVTEEDVLVLGDDNLADAVAEFENILVEFYAPWCGHCKSLAPEYAGAAEYFEDDGSFDVKLAKVDATEHSESAGKYGVSGYPTLKFFKNGEVQDYNGGRTKDEIVSWLKKKTGPSTVTLESADELAAFKESEDVVLVFVGEDISAENKAAAKFMKYASVEDDVAFALTTDFSLVDLEAGADRVVLFKQFDEGRVEFDAETPITKNNLKKFVQPNLLPYVVEFNDKVATKIFGGNVKEHILYFRDAAAEGDDAVLDGMRNLAKEHLGALLFVSVDVAAASNARLAEFFGLKEGMYPTTRIININAQPIKYAPAEFDGTEASFKAFVDAYLAGELSAHLNSEEIPETNDEDVKVVVGKSFNDIVLDESKNVLLMAHAPWCGHCKSLMPAWTELAEAFADNENVVIAKMDATANEVEGLSVQSFPTLKFYPAGGDVVDYDGERTLDGLTAFINKQIGVEAEAEEDASAEAEDDGDDEL